MSRKRTLLSLLILSICPFVFHVIGSACSGNETVNGHKASSSNLVCALVDAECGSDLRSVSDLFCPREGKQYRRVKHTLSLTSIQRLIYELVAAAVVLHATLSNNATGKQHVPKGIKRRFPGLKRKKWREMSVSFSRNILLWSIFYGYHQRHCCSIADFFRLIFHSMRAVSVLFVKYSIAMSICWVRYAIALSIFWVE